jgi:beta-barrel assembly-enhancing protease
MAFVMALVALLGYWGMRERNPFTGEDQHIGLSRDQEVALGLQSEPAMAEQMGGLDPDPALRALVEEVGTRLATRSVAAESGYEFRFHLLRDPETVNAFALPGGPIFITRGLLDRLDDQAQLAGVLGHEIGHVIGRHSAEQIAKSRLAQGLVGAVGVATSDEYGPNRQAQAAAAVVAQMVQLRYGRSDELQSDTLGVRLMAEAGYDPRALIDVMRVLAEAGGGRSQPEFMSSHPDPGNRDALIRDVIERRWPGGVPAHLSTGGPIPRR